MGYVTNYEDIAKLQKHTNMANANVLIPFVLHYEGGFVNDPKDSGGATNKGITLNTFRSVYGRTKSVEDLKKLTNEQWRHIFKTLYWDKCKADMINDQSIANMLVDFAVNSGVTRAVKKIQKIVGVVSDGICGLQTLSAINSSNPRQTFEKLKAARLKYLQDVVKATPVKARFLKGWNKRVNAIEYGKLNY